MVFVPIKMICPNKERLLNIGALWNSKKIPASIETCWAISKPMSNSTHLKDLFFVNEKFSKTSSW